MMVVSCAVIRLVLRTRLAGRGRMRGKPYRRPAKKSERAQEQQ